MYYLLDNRLVLMGVWSEDLPPTARCLTTAPIRNLAGAWEKIASDLGQAVVLAAR